MLNCVVFALRLLEAANSIEAVAENSFEPNSDANVGGRLGGKINSNGQQ